MYMNFCYYYFSVTPMGTAYGVYPQRVNFYYILTLNNLCYVIFVMHNTVGKVIYDCQLKISRLNCYGVPILQSYQCVAMDG